MFLRDKAAYTIRLLAQSEGLPLRVTWIIQDNDQESVDNDQESMDPWA